MVLSPFLLKKEECRSESGERYIKPFYWNLPQRFRGDKVTSYNGYLRFTTHSNGGKKLFSRFVGKFLPPCSTPRELQDHLGALSEKD